jgi:hypothetical protein
MSNPNLNRVEELYVAWTLAEETPAAPRPALTFGELVAFLVEGRKLTQAQQQFLFANRKLRADFQRLKQDLAHRVIDRTERAEARTRVFEMPALAAAASDREVDERSFDGASLRVRPSAQPGQVYIIVQFDDPASAPSALLVESAAGEMARMALTVDEKGSRRELDDDGRLLLVKDLGNETDAQLVRLIRDPLSTGVFLR